MKRFFIVLCFLLPGTPVQSETQYRTADVEYSCNNHQFDETVVIQYVIDGDTVILKDNRHVRLIGINAPEITHNGDPPQPGAQAAQIQLRKLLPKGQNIRLQYDVELDDHYGRTLAHLFLEDGLNIQSKLLMEGLVTPLTIPPNLRYLDCYQFSTKLAFINLKGLWILDRYQAKPAKYLSRTDLGYRVITGTIQRVATSRSAIWLNLEPDVVLRITQSDKQYFDDMDLVNIRGRSINARGWLEYTKGQFRMRIRHPVDLEFNDSHDGN